MTTSHRAQLSPRTPARKNVDLCEVGHHGSRNATPKTLFALWENERDQHQDRLISLLSTKSGVHGRKHDTKVLRETLTEALRNNGKLISTDHDPDDAESADLLDRDGAVAWIDVTSPVNGPSEFADTVTEQRTGALSFPQTDRSGEREDRYPV